MSRSALIIALAALGCTSAAPDETDTDTDVEPGPPLDCLTIEGLLPLVSRNGSEVRERGTVRNACGRSLQVTLDWPLEHPDLSLEPVELIVDDGEGADLEVIYAPHEPGEARATLRAQADDPAVDDAILSVEGQALGLRWAPTIARLDLVQDCPTPIDLVLENVGDTPGDVIDVSVASLEVDVERGEVPGRDGWRPGDTLEVPLRLTLREPPGRLEVSLLDAFVGWSRVELEVKDRPEAIRRSLIEPTPDGPPVDVLVTADRSTASAEEIADGLAGLFQAYVEAGADVRMVGLRRADGCALGGTGPVGPSMDRATAAARLDAQLDLRFNRVTDTTTDERPFELVRAALSPANLADGGCNDWRRPGVPLVAAHLADADDQGEWLLADHLADLRRHVPLDDRLGVIAVAPPAPDGCGPYAPVARIAGAVGGTGGRLHSLCEPIDATALARLAWVPGDPRRIPLDDVPAEVTLRAWRDDGDGSWTEIEVTWDGEAAVLPRTYDPTEDRVRLRYARAADCPSD